MASVRELADGLCARGKTIPGLGCYAYPDLSPELPSMRVNGPIRWTYDDTMDGVWHPVFELVVSVNPADLPRAYQALFAYMAPSGTKSIPAAIHGDTTLGGVADDTRVLGGSRPAGVENTDGGPLLSCALEVEVWAM